MMWEDPIVLEVRCKREELAAQFNFDVHTIFEDMRKRQIAHGTRLVCRKKGEKAEQAATPDRNSAALHPGR